MRITILQLCLIALSFMALIKPKDPLEFPIYFCTYVTSLFILYNKDEPNDK